MNISQSYENLPQATMATEAEDQYREFSKTSLQTIVQNYLNRASTEDIDYLDEMGGEPALLKGLKTNIDKGIISHECEIRRQQYGENSFLTTAGAPFLIIFIKSLVEDNTFKMLLTFTIAYMGLGALIQKENRTEPVFEGLAILVLLCLYNLLPSLIEYLKLQEVRAVSKLCASLKKSIILRNGKWQVCHPAEIVVGDIVKIYPGSIIEADGLVLHAHELHIDESDFIGDQTLQIKKRLQDCLVQRDQIRDQGLSLQRNHIFSPIVLSGSIVREGEGKYVVLSVGKNSSASKFIELDSEDDELGPLQKKLEILMVNIGRVVFLGMVGTFAALLVRWGIAAAMFGSTNFGMQLLDYLLFATIAIIFFIPSDMASSATATMINITRKLRKNKVFVKKINIYEKFAELSEFCMGKTGKITKDQPLFSKFWDFAGIQMPSRARPVSELLPEPAQRMFIESLACNNSADLDSRTGYPLDLAILQYLKDTEIDYQAYQRKHCDFESNSAIFIPFSHTRRRSTVVIPNVENYTKLRTRLHSKGAPEALIKCCDSIYDFKTDETIPFNEAILSEVTAAVSTFSCQGFRPLALAYKEINSESECKMSTRSEEGVYSFERSGLTLLGIIGFEDKLKTNVAPVVAKLKSKGIRFTTVTGDGRQVSKFFTKEAGLLNEDEESISVYEGEGFQDYLGGKIENCMSKFVRIKDHLQLVARALPSDKEDVIKGLIHCCDNNNAENRERHMVGTFGKTLSDYEMMKSEVASVAMGNTSCEVVKNRADVIFLDDELSRLVGLVSWSRHFEISLKQVIQFQLATIFSLAVFVAISCLIFRDTILTPVQWLWLSFVVLLLSVGLGQENPRGEGSARETRRSECDDTGLIDGYLKGFVYLNGGYQLVAYLLLLVLGPYFIPEYLPDVMTPSKESVIYSHGRVIRSGRRYFMNGAPDYQRFINEHGYSRHYTILFSAIVLMQLITVINARCVKRERNMFEEILKSKYLLTSIGAVLGLQVMLVYFGGRLFGVSSKGLHPVHWIIILLLGGVSFVANFCYKKNIVRKLKLATSTIPGTANSSMDFSSGPDAYKSRVEMAKSFDMEM